MAEGDVDLNPVVFCNVQLLQFIGDTLHALVEAEYRLEDIEIDAFVPILLEKSGQPKERFRVAIRELLVKLPALCSYPKYSRLLLQVSQIIYLSSFPTSHLKCLLRQAHGQRARIYLI